MLALLGLESIKDQARIAADQWNMAKIELAKIAMNLKDPEFKVTIEKQGGKMLGLAGLDTSGHALKFVGINEGLIEEWNDKNPPLAVSHDCIIVSANGVSGNAAQIFEECKKNGTLELVIRRPGDKAQRDTATNPSSAYWYLKIFVRHMHKIMFPHAGEEECLEKVAGSTVKVARPTVSSTQTEEEDMIQTECECDDMKVLAVHEGFAARRTTTFNPALTKVNELVCVPNTDRRALEAKYRSRQALDFLIDFSRPVESGYHILKMCGEALLYAAGAIEMRDVRLLNKQAWLAPLDPRGVAFTNPGFKHYRDFDALYQKALKNLRSGLRSGTEVEVFKPMAVATALLGLESVISRQRRIEERFVGAKNVVGELVGSLEEKDQPRLLEVLQLLRHCVSDSPKWVGADGMKRSSAVAQSTGTWCPTASATRCRRRSRRRASAGAARLRARTRTSAMTSSRAHEQQRGARTGASA